jgi:hypothetical protein
VMFVDRVEHDIEVVRCAKLPALGAKIVAQ